MKGKKEKKRDDRYEENRKEERERERKRTKTRGRKYALRSDTIHSPQLVGGEDAGSDWTGDAFVFSA